MHINEILGVRCSIEDLANIIRNDTTSSIYLVKLNKLPPGKSAMNIYKLVTLYFNRLTILGINTRLIIREQAIADTNVIAIENFNTMTRRSSKIAIADGDIRTPG